MTNFTKLNFLLIETAIEYVQATIENNESEQGCQINIEKLGQGQIFIKKVCSVIEDMFEEMPSKDMFFAHIEAEYLLSQIEDFMRLAHSQEDFRDNDKEPEPKAWVDIPEDWTKGCSYCFDRDRGILAMLKSAYFLLDATQS